MILEIIKNIIISIIIITFFHYLYKYLLNEFTIKKTNNILYEEINEFKNINNILNNPNNNSNKNNKNEEKITTEKILTTENSRAKSTIVKDYRLIADQCH